MKINRQDEIWIKNRHRNEKVFLNQQNERMNSKSFQEEILKKRLRRTINQLSKFKKTNLILLRNHFQQSHKWRQLRSHFKLEVQMLSKINNLHMNLHLQRKWQWRTSNQSLKIRLLFGLLIQMKKRKKRSDQVL